MASLMAKTISEQHGVVANSGSPNGRVSHGSPDTFIIARWTGAWFQHRPHKPTYAGSNPACATNPPYLPLPGEIPRKQRRHWKRQILRAHPGLNPAWLDARYEWYFVSANGSLWPSGERLVSVPTAPGPREHKHESYTMTSRTSARPSPASTDATGETQGMEKLLAHGPLTTGPNRQVFSEPTT